MYKPSLPLLKGIRPRPNAPVYPFGLRLDDVYEVAPCWVERSIYYGGLNETGKTLCATRGPNALLLVREQGQPATTGLVFPVQ